MDVSPSDDLTKRNYTRTVGGIEIVEADETYWKALFTSARNHYQLIYEYDEVKKFKARLKRDCNIGKANIYEVLNQVINS